MVLKLTASSNFTIEVLDLEYSIFSVTDLPDTRKYYNAYIDVSSLDVDEQIVITVALKVKSIDQAPSYRIHSVSIIDGGSEENLWSLAPLANWYGMQILVKQTSATTLPKTYDYMILES